MTIYLADDDEDDRIMIRQAIQAQISDAEIIEAVDGQDLVDRITAPHAHKPAIILTDMNMPRMNGLEAVKLIKASPLFKKIPVLMISTSSDPQMIREAYKRGITNYFTKPVIIEGFLKIADAINGCFNVLASKEKLQSV